MAAAPSDITTRWRSALTSKLVIDRLQTRGLDSLGLLTMAQQFSGNASNGLTRRREPGPQIDESYSGSEDDNSVDRESESRRTPKRQP